MRIHNLFLSHLGAVIVPIMIAAGGLLVGFATERALVVSEKADEVARATREALMVSSELERKTTFHNMLAETIADAVGLNPALDQDAFASLVQPFVQTNPGIMNIALAEGLVVNFVYPFEANKSVLGLDYAQRPDQLVSIERMRQRRSTVFSGPIDLVQGEKGYIHRAPIFVKGAGDRDAFWGLVSVVTSEANLLSASSNVISDGFDVAASRVLNRGRTELLWGNPKVLEANPIRETVIIGDQYWEIAVAPTGGWTAVSEWWHLVVVLTSVAVISFTVLSISVRQLLLSRIKSWEQLSKAIEVIDDGFALYDPDDRLVMCNSKYKSFYSASAHLMKPGRTFEDIIRGGVANGQYSEAIGRETDWINERLAKHRNPDGPLEQLLDDGRWLKVFEARMDDGSTVGFRVDITELKKAKQDAESADLAKTEFLNTVSHEIRTPLAAVIGFTTVLRNLHIMPEYETLKSAVERAHPSKDALHALEALDALIKTYARRIDANGVHLLNIINDILYWSSEERRSTNFDEAIVDVSAVLTSVFEQLSGIAKEGGIDLSLRASSESFVLGDRVRLAQVFVNLVGNALKFTQDGTVHVDLTQTDDAVTVRICDTGPGIPESAFDTIFDSFKQLDTGNAREFGGCGLGLAISKDIVAAHGGSISVTSELGVGSTFTVYLPAAERSAQAA